jgi:hypothetical protein
MQSLKFVKRYLTRARLRSPDAADDGEEQERELDLRRARGRADGTESPGSLRVSEHWRLHERRVDCFGFEPLHAQTPGKNAPKRGHRLLFRNKLLFSAHPILSHQTMKSNAQTTSCLLHL